MRHLSTPTFPASGLFWVGLAVLLLTLFPVATQADSGWTERNGQAVAGELHQFDFTEKVAVFQDEDGKLRSIPAEELSTDSRWRLLVSPIFSRSFPKDEWTPEQSRFLVVAVTGPVIFLLISFYLCALVLLKNGNPLLALAGWFGSALLGGFLMSFYLVLSSRSSGSAGGVLILGAIICAGLLSVYVSAIYKTTTWEGLKLLVVHVFGAFFFLALTIITIQRTSQSFDFESVINEKIMIPVGLLPKE
ncbi:MAG: hypothetical protein KDN20_22640 [Verrucomicrobiae bacterium]|nr:hypothetical protein [Verrucomicrobiae bacterium]